MIKAAVAYNRIGRQKVSIILSLIMLSRHLTLPRIQLLEEKNLRLIKAESTDKLLPELKVIPRYLKDSDHLTSSRPIFMSLIVHLEAGPTIIQEHLEQLNVISVDKLVK